MEALSISVMTIAIAAPLWMIVLTLRSAEEVLKCIRNEQRYLISIEEDRLEEERRWYQEGSDDYENYQGEDD